MACTPSAIPVSSSGVPAPPPALSISPSAPDLQHSSASFVKVKAKVRSIDGDVILIDFSITAEGLELIPNGNIVLNSDAAVELLDSSVDRHKTVKAHETYDTWVKVRLIDEGIHRIEVVFPFMTERMGPINAADMFFFEKNKKLKELSPREYDELHSTKKEETPVSLAPTPSCIPTYVEDKLLSGTWYYQDHANTLQGISAPGIQKPIRKALVTIQNRWAPSGTQWITLGTTVTNHSGYFSFLAEDLPFASGEACARHFRAIITPLRSATDPIVAVYKNDATQHLFYSPEISAVNSTFNFGTIVLPSNEASGALNIYDDLLEGYEYMTAAQATTKSVKAYWTYDAPTAIGCGDACYSATAQALYFNGLGVNGSQWEDTLILHEFGHWVMHAYRATIPVPKDPNNSGHGACDEYKVRPNLAWAEGWATFVSSAIRSASIYQDVRNVASLYINANGTIGSSLAFSHDIENNTSKDTTGWRNFCEWAVAELLYDVLDTAVDGTDTIQEPFSEIFGATDATYNGHFPYTLNEWWYGWTNTLGTRTGTSYGSEFAIINHFTSRNTMLGITVNLTWSNTALDIDPHLWLPAATPFQIFNAQQGGVGAFPNATYSGSQTSGSRVIRMISLYPGTYTYAARDWSEPNISASQAKVTIFDGSLPAYNDATVTNVPTYNVPTGTGDWWKVFTLDGATGVRTMVNVTQTTYPAPY
jgi:hypothetical protein